LEKRIRVTTRAAYQQPYSTTGHETDRPPFGILVSAATNAVTLRRFYGSADSPAASDLYTLSSNELSYILYLNR